MPGKYLRLIALGVFMSLNHAPVSAQTVSEYRIKAALLYNLARMVEWPNQGMETAQRPFPICFIGEEPFGDALNAIGDKRVRNRPIEFRRDIALGQAEQCAILFICASESPRLDAIIDVTRDLPLLTVADSEGFAQRGAVINLVRNEKKVLLELNLQAAERAKLNLSPTLLELAEPVPDEAPVR